MCYVCFNACTTMHMETKGQCLPFPCRLCLAASSQSKSLLSCRRIKLDKITLVHAYIPRENQIWHESHSSRQQRGSEGDEDERARERS